MDTPEKQAAYVNSQVACALIEAMGMHASNQRAAFYKAEPPYAQPDFEALIEKFGIHHNAVHGILTG